MILKTHTAFFFFICLHVGFSYPLNAEKAPYTLHVRSSFCTFAKQVFKEKNVEIRCFSGALLWLSAQKNQAHMILGLEDKRPLVKGALYLPYMRGQLAFITRKDHISSIQRILKEKKIIGQDPRTSSTGATFKAWALCHGFSEESFARLFYAQTGSLAAAYRLFLKESDTVLVAYTTTPLLKSEKYAQEVWTTIPLNAYETWGIVVTPRGKSHERTKEIIAHLYQPEAQEQGLRMLLLESLPYGNPR